MRKVLLVIGLIGASFAGGAAVNGPGQDLLRTYLLRDRDPIYQDDLASGLPMAGAGAAVEEVEAAAALRAESDSAALAAARSSLDGEESVSPEDDPFPAAPPRRLDDDESEESPSNEAPPLEPPRADRASSSRAAAADATPATTTTPPAPPEVPAPAAPRSEAATPTLEPIPLSDTPGQAVPAAVEGEGGDDQAPADSSVAKTQAPIPTESAPTSSDPATEPADPSAEPTPTDWRARLAGAGVVRYWIEGETNGRVRLRGVIPLAGETAVGQQFEAEADDEASATELVLRRIALWQATREATEP